MSAIYWKNMYKMNFSQQYLEKILYIKNIWKIDVYFKTKRI